MYAPTHTTTTSRSEHAVDPTGPTAGHLVRAWARGRRQMTPWAYPRMRGLAIMRFAIGIFLTGVAAVLSYYGHYGFAAIPLAGAALHFSIASLDMSAARFVRNRT
jgi:hypothetical protein